MRLKTVTEIRINSKLKSTSPPNTTPWHFKCIRSQLNRIVIVWHKFLAFKSYDFGSSDGDEMALSNCKMVDLPKISDPRGNLTFIESGRHIPFDIKRVYYLYDVPGGAERGGHAHKELHQLIIAISGSFDIVIDDGQSQKRVHLARSYYGLYVCPMIWREMDNFSSGSVALVLASDFFKESDYYRNYDEFVSVIRNKFV